MNIDFPVSLFMNASLVLCWLCYLLRFRLKMINLLILSIFFANTSISLAVFICGILGVLTPFAVFMLTFLLPIGLLAANFIFSDSRKSWFDNSQNFIKNIYNLNFNNFGSLLLFLLLFLGIYIVFLGAILPADGFDSFIYHYTIPAKWVEQGSFARIAGPKFHGLGYWFQYPAGMELTFAWHFLFQGNDFWIECAGWPYWVLGVLTVYAWLKSLKASYTISLVGAAIWGIIPLVVTQQLGGYIDAALSSQILAASYLGYKFLKSEEISFVYLIAAVMALAWIPGIKGSGIVFVIFILFLWTLFSLENYFLHDKKLHIKWLAVFYASCFGAVLIFSGYWYFRNYFDYGNPFYPFKFSLLGIEIFSGVSHTHWLSWPEGEPLSNFYLAFHEKLAAAWNENYPCWFFGESRGGFGPLTSVLMPIFFPIGLTWIVIKKRFSLVLGFGFGALIFYFTSPALFPRYALPLLGFYIIISICALHYLKPRMLINVIILIIFIYHFMNLFALNWNRSKNILAGLDNPRQGSAEFNYGKQYKMFNQIVPQNAVVAYDHIFDPYHLISPHLDRKLFYFNHKDGYFKWLSGMNKESVDYFIYGYKNEGLRAAYLWALNSKFMQVVYEDKKIAIFKIKKKRLQKHINDTENKISSMFIINPFQNRVDSGSHFKSAKSMIRFLIKTDQIVIKRWPQKIAEPETKLQSQKNSLIKVETNKTKNITNDLEKEKNNNSGKAASNNMQEKQAVVKDELKRNKDADNKTNRSIKTEKQTN
jgi:hypothetical protein